jgi:predicted outer membrane repeat protein
VVWGAPPPCVRAQQVVGRGYPAAPQPRQNPQTLNPHVHTPQFVGRGCALSHNTAGEGGGALCASATAVSLVGCTVHANSVALGTGGAVLLQGGGAPAAASLVVSSNFTGNHAAAGGALGLQVLQQTPGAGPPLELVLRKSRLVGNQVGRAGAVGCALPLG